VLGALLDALILVKVRAIPSFATKPTSSSLAPTDVEYAKKLSKIIGEGTFTDPGGKSISSSKASSGHRTVPAVVRFFLAFPFKTSINGYSERYC
jgi:hypothetical protein